MIDPYIAPEPEPAQEQPTPTDFASLIAAPPPPSDLPALRRSEQTDFATLTADLPRRPPVVLNRGFADYCIDFITPLLLFILVNALLSYLLNVRYVYTAVHDIYLRIFAVAFVLGIVALNRLIARQGSQESFLYMGVLMMAVALYTLATTELYGMGSVSRNFMNDQVWMALLFNMSVVIFLWWLVNRLTHECCVDENKVAGDIGMFTATAEKLRHTLRRAATPPPPTTPRPQAVDINEPWHGITAFDPLEKDTVKAHAPEPAPVDFSARLPKRHPGMALFYFSAPVLLVFALGLRVIQHLGEPALRMGAFYLYVYIFCVLLLLSMTCLRQLRIYFSLRNVTMPGALPWYWLGLSVAMIILIMWSAAQMPMPEIPPPAYVDYHQRDVYIPQSAKVTLLDVTPRAVTLLDRVDFTTRLNTVMYVFMALLLLYGLLKIIQIVVVLALENRHRLPSMVNMLISGVAWLLFKLFPSLLRWSFPRRRLRIQRNIALSVRYDNPLARPNAARPMTTREHVAYAYEALCALATDVGEPRKTSQTPFEFLEDYPKRLTSMKEEAEEVIRLYTVAAYSAYEIDHNIEDRLRKFWIAFRHTRNFYVY